MKQKPTASNARSERILDCAEALFCRFGFDGVTLRKIAQAAEVDVALTSYYFGSKANLFDNVLSRRGEMLNMARRQALEAAKHRAGGGPVPIEQIIAAFLQPLALVQGAEKSDWGNYCALVAYVNNSPALGKQTMQKHFDALVREFTDAMRETYPETAPENIYWCYYYMSGALSLVLANTGRIDNISEGLCQSDDFEQAYQRMIPFMAAGFESTCG